MTPRADRSRRGRAPSRAERKAALLAAIEQQRIDMLVEASRWHEASRPIDHGWHRLMRFRTAFVAAGGVMLFQGARRPHSLLGFVRRAATTALLVNRARRLLER